MWTTKVGNYSLPSFPVSDLGKWDLMTDRSNPGSEYKPRLSAHRPFNRRQIKKDFPV